MEKKFVFNEDTALVQTKKGKVQGYFYNDIYIFKGIPYAKARRFHAPEEADAWAGVLQATSYGYVCPLLEMPKPSGELMVSHRFWVMDEDCLNLNIWTPGLDEIKRPVMVWLHGGGFFAGSAIEQNVYEGENMCRLGQVVVVSINHRLNILGYCDLSAFGKEYENSGNAGTDDIVAALKWIQENIRSFGGDPDNVTIFGQSGGGAKVTALLQTPAADGLYAKGINMSGVISDVLGDSVGSGETLGKVLMKELHVKNVKELEGVPYSNLAVAYRKAKAELEAKGEYVGCSPYPNGFYKGDPITYGFRLETGRIPLIVGSVFGEFASFSSCHYDRKHLSKEEGIQIVEQAVGKKKAAELIRLFQMAYPERNPADILTLDFIFRHPEIEYIKLRSACNGKIWSYLFNLDMPFDGGRTPWHCADIPYFFHNTEMAPYTQEEGVTEKVEKLIFNSIMSFAKTGNPQNPEIPLWRTCTREKENTLIIGKDTRIGENFDHELISVLKKCMGSVYSEKMRVNKQNIQH